MSTELDYTDDELYDEFEEEDMQEERPAGAGAFRFVSVLLFLIAVAGLFIGMIPALESSITTGEGTWSGSLFAAILETFKGLFGLEHATTDFNLLDPLSSSQYPYTYGIGKIAEYLPYVIAGAVVVSLVTMIVSFASAKAAKGSAYTGGVIILLAYGFFFAFLFAARSYFGLTGLRAITDLPSAIIVGAVVIVLAISSIALKKGYGLANSICVLLAIVAIVAFLYPGETVIADIRQVLLFEDGASIAKTVILLGMSAVLALNLLISIFRFAAKRAYPFDAVRHFVMFGFAVATACLYLFADGFASPDWEALAKLPLILLLASSLAAFLVSLLCCIAVSVRKSKAIAEEEENGEDDSLALTDEAPAEKAETEKTTAIAEAPAAATAVAVSPAAAAPVAEPPMSEFEKRMSEIAQGTQREQPAAHDSTVIYNGHYTYDAFMGTLTGEEKTEFGNLFISKKYGMQNYLPTYVVGGNNDEFFSKVFIYLGKYRSFISSNLLEKMYRFVNNEM